MKTSIILSQEDLAQLRALLKHECAGPWPTHSQAEPLAAILKAAAKSATPEPPGDHAGLGDRVTLVCPVDFRDTYQFTVVMPHEADIDQDLVSVNLPISQAALGHKTGADVSWVTPGGVREMRIVAIEKAGRAMMAG